MTKCHSERSEESFGWKMDMFTLLKNPELRRELLVYSGVTLLLFGLGFLISWQCAVVLLAAGALFTGLHVWMMCRRYRALAELSREVDRLLHDEQGPTIRESEEGELAILRSEIRKMALRLQEAAESSRHDKLTLSSGLADISHQLRTPLTAMHLTASLLAKPELEEARRLSLTRELKKELSRIDWLVETLLKLSKLDAGTVQFARDPVSVRELIAKATQSLLIPMELRGQTLEIAAAEDAVFTGDLAWSAEALSNLVKNCMEHTPEGGRLEVTARQTALFTEITVSDNGPGFDPADLPHLFERFYRGKNAGRESIGIGLSLARAVAAAQNGTLKAGNPPTGGACFELRFYHTTI